MTPTHIPPAMRGKGVPAWIVEVPVSLGDLKPPFMWLIYSKVWWAINEDTLVREDDINGVKSGFIFARAATPTEITAARDGGRGDA